MRWPSVAVPHSMPPSEAPGPTGVLQTMLPLSGLSAQKMPLFWPKPTILPTRLGPDPPRSKSGLVGTGQLALGPVGVRHATVHVSRPCSLLAHLTCPRFRSIAGGCQIAPPLYPPGCPPLSGMSKVFQSIAPVFSSSATILPRKLQQGYVGSRARVSSLDETPI